jgi:hypothetical protein
MPTHEPQKYSTHAWLSPTMVSPIARRGLNAGNPIRSVRGNAQASQQGNGHVGQILADALACSQTSWAVEDTSVEPRTYSTLLARGQRRFGAVRCTSSRGQFQVTHFVQDVGSRCTSARWAARYSA